MYLPSGRLNGWPRSYSRLTDTLLIVIVGHVVVIQEIHATYHVGVVLIVAALSIATRIQVRWSGLLFGIMMFLFVAMIHLPGAIKSGDRIIWTIVIREMSFGGGGLVLAGIALGRSRGKGNSLITGGRVLIAIAAIFFGASTFCTRWECPEFRSQNRCPRGFPLVSSLII